MRTSLQNACNNNCAAAIERYLQSMAQRFVDRAANKHDDTQLTEVALVSAGAAAASDAQQHTWYRQKRKAQWGRYHHQMDEVAYIQPAYLWACVGCCALLVPAC